ncbi:metal ABC transporter permease [Phytohalomonas tamaricis]|uniref:metal ABC transporter permease n=1 Tax=Phytohalomonas tamaricis TaxID=2081032 RepID=UPI000D0B061C|nr:metal ABC transporter permease [Phytohalomonas tamaricis]
MIDTLLMPFSYGFMARSIWVGGSVGVVCALLSCFIILKGWSLLGDALSHAVVPGVAIAYWLGLPFVLGAFVSGLLAVLGIGVVRGNSALKGDAVIGVVFTAFFALGFLLISLNPSTISLTTILFGNLLGISSGDAWQLVAIAGGCIVIIALRWKDLLLYCFDEQHARALGFNVRYLNILLLAMMSLTAVAALQTVGAILVIAMLITPGATAYLLTDRFGHMLWIAPLVGGLTAMTGAYLSFFFDTSVGGLIVVLQTLVFLIAFMLAPRHGLLAHRRRWQQEASS